MSVVQWVVNVEKGEIRGYDANFELDIMRPWQVGDPIPPGATVCETDAEAREIDRQMQEWAEWEWEIFAREVDADFDDD